MAWPVNCPRSRHPSPSSTTPPGSPIVQHGSQIIIPRVVLEHEGNRAAAARIELHLGAAEHAARAVLGVRRSQPPVILEEAVPVAQRETESHVRPVAIYVTQAERLGCHAINRLRRGEVLV